jgi:ubiquinone/menaquinone biosynthesis C-methylase UbiE
MGGADYSLRGAEEYAAGELAFFRQGEYSKRLSALGIDVTGFRILDLAAGPGTWELALAELGPSEIVWHDRSEAFYQIARTLHAEAGLTNIRYQLRDMQDLDYPAASFDMVICRLAIHHARNEWTVLDGIAHILKPGGYFYLEAHNYRYAWSKSGTKAAWKYPIVLLAPPLAVLTRNKIVRTKFSFETLIRMHLQRRGFELISNIESGPRTAFRLLLRRG